MFVCRLREGRSVAIGDRVLTILMIHRPGVATVSLDGGDRFGLIWDRQTQILPGIFASVDRKNSFSDRVTLHLSAPKDVKLARLDNDGHPEPYGNQER